MLSEFCSSWASRHGKGAGILIKRYPSPSAYPAALSAGTVKLVGTDTELIVRETLELLEDHFAYYAMSLAQNPYEDGYAAQKNREP